MGLDQSEDTSNIHFVFAGTGNSLFAVTVGMKEWQNLSGETYSTPYAESWNFAQYKNLEIATNFGDPVQVYDMETGGVFSGLSPGAPMARYVAVAKGFVILGGTNDPVGGFNPARTWWSGVNDPTNWPTPGSALAQQVMSDYNDLVGPQGNIMGLVPNLYGSDCAVFFERGVFLMTFAGPPAVFNFYPATSVKGTPAPNSIVALGGNAYYLGEDGFYAFNGFNATPIGANKIDKWFFANVDQNHFELVVGAPDIANKAICWIFPSVNASNPEYGIATEDGNALTTEDGSVLVTQIAPLQDMMLIYRWDINRWTYGMYNQQRIARVPVVSTAAGQPPSIAPLTAGQLQLSSVDEFSYLAFFTGANLAAQVGTKVVQITPNSRSFVNATRPLIDSSPFGSFIATEAGDILETESGDLLTVELPTGANVTVAMSARNTYQDVEVFGPEQSIDVSGQCSQRSEGRYHRGRITVPAIQWTTMAGLDVVGQRASLR